MSAADADVDAAVLFAQWVRARGLRGDEPQVADIADAFFAGYLSAQQQLSPECPGERDGDRGRQAASNIEQNTEHDETPS